MKDKITDKWENEDDKRFNVVDHQRLVTATQILASLLSTNKNASYEVKESIVDIALGYTELLLTKLDK